MLINHRQHRHEPRADTRTGRQPRHSGRSTMNSGGSERASASHRTQHPYTRHLHSYSHLRHQLGCCCFSYTDADSPVKPSSHSNNAWLSNDRAAGRLRSHTLSWRHNFYLKQSADTTLCACAGARQAPLHQWLAVSPPLRAACVYIRPHNLQLSSLRFNAVHQAQYPATLNPNISPQFPLSVLRKLYYRTISTRPPLKCTACTRHTCFTNTALVPSETVNSFAAVNISLLFIRPFFFSMAPSHWFHCSPVLQFTMLTDFFKSSAVLPNSLPFAFLASQTSCHLHSQFQANRPSKSFSASNSKSSKTSFVPLSAFSNNPFHIARSPPYYFVSIDSLRNSNSHLAFALIFAYDYE